MSKWRDHRGVTGRDPQRDVDDELQFHIDMRVRELVARGETEERARELALTRFGAYDAPRGECIAIDERQGRRQTRVEYMSEFRQDVLYALRTLRRAPVFTLIAVLTLGLGIGANSAIFSVVNAVLLESLPFRDAGRLYVVQTSYPDGTLYPLSPPDYMSVRADNRVFENVVTYGTTMLTVTGLGEPREVQAVLAGSGTLEELGIRVGLGRSFAAEEHVPGQHRVVVLDHGFWQREFGGDPGVLARTVTVGGQPFTVVGVLAEGHGLVTPRDIYVPLQYDETFDAGTATGRRGEYLSVIGRARPGVTGEAIEAELRRVGADLNERFPQTNERLTFGATPAREAVVGAVRTPLLVLLGAVAFVLLVACANVANLLLARASARQGELAVRSALGAGRGRLVRQMLTESVVLGVLGGVTGLAIAGLGVRALVNAQPADIPRLDRVDLDGTVLLVTLGLSLLTGLLFGAIPALQATRGRLTQMLRDDARTVAGGAGKRLRASLVVAEIAVAVMLLVGAGLLLRSFGELTRVRPGFEAERGLAFRINMPPSVFAEGQHVRDFVDVLFQRLKAMPGVTAVGGTSVLPLSGVTALVGFAVEGAPPPPESVNREISLVSVTPEYFTTIGARIELGRALSDEDRAGGPLVALINQAGARKWFPGENPIGRTVNIGTVREVVGVVSDVLQESPGAPAVAELYVPHQQRTTRTLRVVVRTAGEPRLLAPAIRAELRGLAPDMPVSDFTPLTQLFADAVARPRFYTALLTLFAAVALALAAIGIFGVMSYTVAQRAREISIRMALGARAGSVVAMIVRTSVLLAALGLLLGTGGALLLGRVLRSQLYNVSTTDPVTLVGVALVLLAAAGLASWLPARRAAGVDPGLMLRGG